MEMQTKLKLKKNLIIAGIFLSLTLILFSLSFLDFVKQNIVKASVMDVLISSNIPSEYKNITNIKAIKSYNELVFPIIFKGEIEGNTEIFLYLARLTGKYGSYMSVFIYDTKKGEVLFIGLLVDDKTKEHSYYGISKGAINYWKDKIKEICDN